MDLNIREMLLGHTQRLRYVVRFGTCYRVHNESVAEHSFYTALYAQLMSQQLEKNHRDFNTELVIKRALLHDAEEARSGDFPRPYKYSSPELTLALKKSSSVAFVQCFLPMLRLDSDLQALLDLWQLGKDNTLEGMTVEFSDYLSVLSYIWSEINGSNKTMREHLHEMDKYQAIFEAPEYKFLEPWVQDARQILKEVMS